MRVALPQARAPGAFPPAPVDYTFGYKWRPAPRRVSRCGENRGSLVLPGPAGLQLLSRRRGRSSLLFCHRSFAYLAAAARAAAILALVAGAIWHHQHAALAARRRALVSIGQLRRSHSGGE